MHMNGNHPVREMFTGGWKYSDRKYSVNVGNIWTVLEIFGQRWKYSDNFEGPNCPNISNLPVNATLNSWWTHIMQFASAQFSNNLIKLTLSDFNETL